MMIYQGLKAGKVVLGVSLRNGLGRGVLLMACYLLVTACATLPVDRPSSSSTAFSDPESTSLGQMLSPYADRDPSRSGFALLDTGRDALKARLAAIDMADQAIDLQYYIWNSDYAGRLLAQKVLQAADRGVRVRLLIDDFNVGDRDKHLSAMDVHPSVDVRIYNPNVARTGLAKGLLFVTDFGRLNQRMHNKSMVVDGSLSIVGGRNIGDEYFDLDDEMNFRDRELLAVGPIVAEVSQGFDKYWNGTRSFSISEIADATSDPGDLTERRALWRSPLLDRPQLRYPVPEGRAAARTYLATLASTLVWAEAEFLMDEVLDIDQTDGDKLKAVAQKISALAQATQNEVLIESAYLVLGEPAVSILRNMRDRGVKVEALTNSLASNDVTGNHAAYARRRLAMLESGLQLHELRPDAESCEMIVGMAEACTDDRLLGLHSKTVVFDQERLFIGSFNLNLRSAYLNSELGLLVHSDELAQRVASGIKVNMQPQNSWRVALDDNRRVVWIDDRHGTEVSLGREPQVGAWRRFWAGLIAAFPIEKYL